MNGDHNSRVQETLDGLQSVRDQLDSLAQKLSPADGFSEHHAMILRLYSDAGYAMKRIRSRSEQLKNGEHS